MKPKIALIGTGLLGRPMAERLLLQGFPLTVFNRTRAKAELLASQGAEIAESPAAAAHEADVVITVVADDEALKAVCFDPDGTVMSIRAGATHVQMSTVSAPIVTRLAAAVQARGAALLDAPVLGSAPQAAAGELVVMVGGTEEALENNRSLLETLGKRIVHAGPVGAGSHLKLVANQFLASLMLAFAQGMTLARKAGLPPDRVMEVLDASALHSRFFSSKAERLRKRDFRPNFPVKWMLKDINLILQAGEDLGVPLPGVAVTREAYVAAMVEGLAESDYSALVQVLERASGIR